MPFEPLGNVAGTFSGVYPGNNSAICGKLKCNLRESAVQLPCAKGETNDPQKVAAQDGRRRGFETMPERTPTGTPKRRKRANRGHKRQGLYFSGRTGRHRRQYAHDAQEVLQPLKVKCYCYIIEIEIEHTTDDRTKEVTKCTEQRTGLHCRTTERRAVGRSGRRRT